MRAAIVLELAVIAMLASQPAHAVVRRSGFPAAVRGEWAPNGESCQASGKTHIFIRKHKIKGPKVSCKVEYVSEGAVASGALYSSHGSCFDRTKPHQKSFMNLIIEPLGGGRASIGMSLDSLIEYQHCD